MQQRIVIAGGSGFLGSRLAQVLASNGHEVVVLSRQAVSQLRKQSREHASLPIKQVQWDARTLGPWTTHIDGADAIVNLVGRSVDCIKTPAHCDEILRSRVESTAVLGQAIDSVVNKPRVWVQMSTAHIYGDPPSNICDEDSPFGYGLAPIVGKAWEDTFHRVAPTSIRKVILRTSFVMGRKGGALSTLAHLARFGLGGTIGSGTQGMSWIHEDDMNRLFLRAIHDNTMQGAYIATAPNPVSNKHFMRALRKATHRPFGLPAYALMVNIVAPYIMRTDPELVLYGRYCVSKRLAEEGFKFEYGEIEGALKNLLNGERQ